MPVSLIRKLVLDLDKITASINSSQLRSLKNENDIDHNNKTSAEFVYLYSDHDGLHLKGLLVKFYSLTPHVPFFCDLKFKPWQQANTSLPVSQGKLLDI